MIQHTVTYMMSGCLLPPHLISEMFYLSASVRYTHNPLLHMVTPMGPYRGSATQMQPTGGYQDAEDQTNRDGKRWPTASYWQIVLLQWLPAPVLALRWYSMGFRFSPLCTHVCVKWVPASSQVQSEAIASENSAKKCHFYTTLIQGQSPVMTSSS